MTVTTEAVRRDEVMAKVVGTGVVEVWQEAVVGSETSGLMLAQVLVAEGDEVSEGQVLARLDATLLKAQVAEQDAAIRSAEATLQEAQTAFARAGKLVETGHVTAETVDTRETAVRTATAALEQVQAKRQTLAVQVDRATVRAPFAGIVSAKPAVVGTVVQVGTEIARVQRDGALDAKLKVPEAKLAALSVGDLATIVGPDGSSVEATVSTISATVDAVTHLAGVSVRLPKGTRLRAGMFVRGTIHGGDGNDRLTVPSDALTWADGGAAVFTVAEDGTVTRRGVGIDERIDDRVVVSGDLRPGEAVATAGAGFLKDGDRVAVAQRSAVAEETVR